MEDLYVLVFRRGLPIPFKIQNKTVIDDETIKSQYFKWDEIKEVVVDFYMRRAEEWQKMKEEDYTRAVEEFREKRNDAVYMEMFS